ncbi:MAG: SUMF1/EgtB/PvdO family nonheme iron enzyme [Treponema sp.]|nr:SUMF1/EgtB/PvdO family nonheme iron enzyme [Treponema sp.]
MATELRDSVIEEYTNNVDMYNSLLTRGDPIIYFEIDYNVTAESDDKPSEYKFNFNKIRVINTVSGKSTQTSALSKVQPRTMKPEWDLRPISGVVEKEFLRNLKMIAIPGKSIEMISTEVTQKMYQKIMGENPSKFKGENNPVECVSWYDAVYFCNKLSETMGVTPVYSVEGLTDVKQWNYKPNQGNRLRGEITQNLQANGFRLPTLDEWIYAARGGENYRYAGSDNLDEVGWYYKNSGEKTHSVAQKKANGYGLYDMSGNVWEWVWDWDSRGSLSRYICGGSWFHQTFDYDYAVYKMSGGDADYQYSIIGFRIVRPF